MADSHLSIGEVLGLLQEEFPDVTISKIRFLESQGLIDPERTPSGYRKFYEADIDRLRWILLQQREHFLPLKVIKDRLAGVDGAPSDDEPLPAATPAVVEAPAPMPTAPERVEEAVPAAAHAALAAASAEEVAERPQPIWMADLARAAQASPATGGLDGPVDPPRLPMQLDGAASPVSLTATELVAASGLTFETLRELEQYGLVEGRPLGDDTYYDGDALLIATKAKGFMEHGVGARHLRMFKVAAEREAGFLEQLTMPLLKQRNPQARRQAVELVEELSGLGHDLRAALLRGKLRRHLDQG